MYDIFFIGSYWQNVPSIVVNVFGDGTCTADESHIIDGMNRNIAVHTVSDGGGSGLSFNEYTLDRSVGASLQGERSLFLVPPIFTVAGDTSEVQRIIVKDVDNTAIWGSGTPSFKLSFNGDATPCLDYSSTEIQVGNYLNNLLQLCPGHTDCVTVTRSTDPVHAPNGYVFSIYFIGDTVSNMDIIDPGPAGLVADTTSIDCTPFSIGDGELLQLETVFQGKKSPQFTASQVPLESAGISLPSTWLREDITDIPLFRITGTFWTVNFSDNLGDMASMALIYGTLPGTAKAEVFDNLVQGSNPTSAIISGLSTGVPYYGRVSATTEVGTSVSSETVELVPSKVPASPKKLSASHALHVSEVQSITLAATHINEVQAVKTSAIPMPEVQEIILDGTSGEQIDEGFLSLRFPEVQTVTWSSGSPVISGYFFLKLNYVDTAASLATGNVEFVTKELKTHCITFDASAVELKHAIET